MNMNKFKNIAKSALLGCVVLLAPAIANAGTAVHVTERMINGTYLCVSNSTTASISASNQWYYGYQYGTNVLGGSVPFTIQTNWPSQGVNTTNYFNPVPSPLVNVGVFPDINADVNPNVALQIVIGYTNQLFALGVQSPVLINTVWTNPAPFFAGNIGATNSWTVTLTPVATGDFPLDTLPTKTFSVSGLWTNGVPLVLTTNVPTAFLQGLKAVSPSITVGPGTNAAPNGIVFNAINLTGWSP